jgi:uncharacterized protein
MIDKVGNSIFYLLKDIGMDTSKLFDAVKAGVKAGVDAATESSKPGLYEAADIKIVCSHCKGDLFTKHEAMLNTRGATFLKLDWADQAGVTLICDNCGLIQWFAKAPVRL